MPIKDIILHQGPDTRSETRLDIAMALAKARDTRVIGVFVKVDPGDPEHWWIAFGEEAIAEWLSILERIGGEAEKAFKTRLAEEGLEGEWRVIDGNPTDAMMTAPVMAI